MSADDDTLAQPTSPIPVGSAECDLCIAATYQEHQVKLAIFFQELVQDLTLKQIEAALASRRNKLIGAPNVQELYLDWADQVLR